MNNRAPPSNRRIGLHLLPQTWWGWSSAGLFLAAVLLFLATIVVVQVADQPGYAGFPMITSGVATVGGGIAAAVAILRHQERGVLVVIPLITALLLVVFVIGETVSPH